MLGVFRFFICTLLWSTSLQAALQTYIFPLKDRAYFQEIPADQRASDKYKDVARPVLDFIQEARTSLEGCVYVLDYPPIVHALLQAKKRGVSVGLFVETSPFHHPGSPQKPTNIALLKAPGIQVIEKLPLYKKAQLHAKFLIADRKKLLLTTMNWDTESFMGTAAWYETPPSGDAPTREVAFIIDDPALVTEALQWYTWAQGVSVPDLPPETFLNFGPLRSTRSYIATHLEAAKTSLHLWQQSVEDDAVVDLLITLQKRGVEVSLVMTTDPFQAARTGRPDRDRPNLKRLAQAGSQVFLLPSFREPYIHIKGAIIDGRGFLFTSANFYGPSLDEGFEASTFLKDPQMLKQLEDTFQKDMAEGILVPN